MALKSLPPQAQQKLVVMVATLILMSRRASLLLSQAKIATSLLMLLQAQVGG